MRRFGLATVAVVFADQKFLPPAHLSVANWKTCTDTEQRGSASFVCKPASQPAGCSDFTWDQLFGYPDLGNAITDCQDDSSGGNRPIVGGPGTLPPLYLSVPEWRSCTGSKDMGTWDAVCKPQSQPSECPNDSWNQLFGEDGVGYEDLENCEENGAEPPINIGEGIATPAHLSVEGWEKCAGTRKFGSGENDAGFACKPLIQPIGCPTSTWNQLYGHPGFYGQAKQKGVADYFFDCQELQCDLSWHEGIFWSQGVLNNGKEFYAYSPDYKLKKSQKNRFTGEELQHIGKIKKKFGVLEASIEQMQAFNIKPVETWVVCKNNPKKMVKLQCHFNPFGEVGRQWDTVTIDGAENGPLPSCVDEPPAERCNQADLNGYTMADRKCEKKFLDDNTELPGGFCWRRCTKTTPGLVAPGTTPAPGTPTTPGTSSYDGYRAVALFTSPRRVACICENGECGYFVKIKGGLVPYTGACE